RKYSTLNGSQSIKFYFKGTSLRIIGSIVNSTTYSNSIPVTIDGIEMGVINGRGSSTITQALVFEKIGMSNSFHEVEIAGIKAVSGIFSFDAIDINEDGELRTPYDGFFSVKNQTTSKVYSLDN